MLPGWVVRGTLPAQQTSFAVTMHCCGRQGDPIYPVGELPGFSFVRVSSCLDCWSLARVISFLDRFPRDGLSSLLRKQCSSLARFLLLSRFDRCAVLAERDGAA